MNVSNVPPPPRQTDPRCVLCLKWGTLYDAACVNRLYQGVRRFLRGPFRFICFTDDAHGLCPEVEIRDLKDLLFDPRMEPGIWYKLALLHPRAGLQGDCLFLDLDLVILDSLEEFFLYPGEFCIIHNWIERRKRVLRPRPHIGNSSVYRFSAGSLGDVLEQFLSDPRYAKNAFPTEQAFLTHAVGRHRLRFWPESWVRSFKYHCRPIFPLNLWRHPRLPADARILVFHGLPKAEQAVSGYPGRLWQRTLPCPELSVHLSE